MADKMIIGTDGKPMFISSAINMGQDGKPVFIGQDNPSRASPTKRGERSMMICPQCQKEVDYLLGDTDTATGEMQGCEGCYKPPRLHVTPQKEVNIHKDDQTYATDTTDPKKVQFD